MLSPKYTPEFQKVLDRCESIGQKAGIGKGSLGALALTIAESIRDGHVKNVAVVKGVPNDLKPMWDFYCKGENAKKPAERSAGSVKTQMSKLQAIANAAKAQSDFAFDTMVRVVDIRKDMINTDVATIPLFDSFVEVAKAAVKAGCVLSDEAIIAACTKPAGKETTFVSIIEAMREKLEKMLEGKGLISVPLEHCDSAREMVTLCNKMVAVPETEVDKVAREAAEQARKDFVARQLAAEQSENVHVFETADAISEERLAA